MTKKGLASVGLIIVILCFFSRPGEANNSSYESRMNIGEVRSNIYNKLNLDISRPLADKNLRLVLGLVRNDVFVAGRYQDYGSNWEIAGRELPVVLTDYRLELKGETVQLEAGLLDNSAGGGFGPPRGLQGIRLETGPYQLLGGRSFATGRWRGSLRYDGKARDLEYRLQEKPRYAGDYKHYLGYQEAFSPAGGRLHLDSTIGLDRTEGLWGTKNRLRFDSRFRSIGYTLVSEVTTPGFEAVNSSTNLGTGSYQISMGGQKLFQSLVVDGNLSYSRSNWTREGTTISRRLKNSWVLTYYAPENVNYELLVDYRLNTEYNLKQKKQQERTDRVKLDLGYQNSNLSSNISYIYHYRSPDNFSWRTSYTPGNYRVTGNYSWWEASSNSWDLSFGKQKKIIEDLIYDASLQITEASGRLSQSINYNFGGHRFNVRLGLRGYWGGSGINRDLQISYRYSF